MQDTLFLVANFKEHKTTSDVLDWLALVGPKLTDPAIKVVVAPQFPSLAQAKAKSTDFAIALAAQDVASTREGAFTGEVTAATLKDFVSYVIVGHSERRHLFGEVASDVAHKVEQLLACQITPIVCLSDDTLNEASQYHGKAVVIAYEPLEHIGTGEALDPPSIAKVVNKVRDLAGQPTPVLYGGSVDHNNALAIIKQSQISGFLVGTASLDPQNFLALYDGIRTAI